MSCLRVVVGSLSSVSTWSPLQVMADHRSSDILIPLNPADSQPGSKAAPNAQQLHTHETWLKHFLIPQCSVRWPPLAHTSALILPLLTLSFLYSCLTFTAAEKEAATEKEPVAHQMKCRDFLWWALPSVSLPFCLSELCGGHGCVSSSVRVNRISGKLWERRVAADIQVSCGFRGGMIALLRELFGDWL